MKNRFHAGPIPAFNGMTLKFVPFVLLVVLMPLTQKKDTSGKTNRNLHTAFHSPAPLTQPFLENDQQKPISDVEQLKQSDWYGAALKNIENREYRFTKVKNVDAYSTPNRKNNLRFYYDENGFSVEPRTTQIPLGDYDPIKRPDEIKYKTIPNWKIAFQLDKKQVGQGSWQISENKAEYKTDNITVQYVNNEEGMRQNFIVQKPLSENNDLNLNFSVKTKLKQNFSSDRLQFIHDKSGAVLNYDELKVWDANGKLLAAAFEKNNDDYSIHVNTTDALYPITIDPISTSPVAMVESNQVNAQLGYSVASAGDVNSDGYNDVIVGSPYYDNGQTDEGVAFIYHGSVTGINTIAAAMVECDQANASMGWSVAGAGDVNRDGYSDVIVGAPKYDYGGTDEGAIFIYHGSATGISTTAAKFEKFFLTGANMGWSVAGAGDVNGDEYSDVIVGVYNYYNGQAKEGAAIIYLGSATGISASAIIESNLAYSNFGYSVASAGDINRDGYSDVIVGIPYYTNGQANEGAAFIYHGGASLSAITTRAAIIESDLVNAWMGLSVAGAGDINGDGYSDVIVGAPDYQNGESAEGAAFIYHGSATGINSTRAATIESNLTNAQLGNSVAGAGDVNGDGYSDVIIGAHNDNGGSAFVYHGSATGVDVTIGIHTTARIKIEGNIFDAGFGCSVAGAGDVNGDGYSDVIVGARYHSNGQSDEGIAFIYHGSGAGTKPLADVVKNNQWNAYLGWSVASAGDVNGDGYSDVIVGAYLYDNGQINEGAAFIYHGSATGIKTTAATLAECDKAHAHMGWSVASAGDINGDGYSDVIVGAPEYSNNALDEGAAFIFKGSTAGINTAATVLLGMNQPGSKMGYSVACAGDVNGDGRSDVIVGAPYFDNGETDEGTTFIYHGSANGINTTAAGTLESNQANAQMGQSVASAGDVNGDGYGDVITGVPGFDNSSLTDAGGAFIYHGSPTGVNTPAPTIVQSNQANAQLGYSVAGAGDVNGDGYGDVMVGSPTSANGGTAFIHYGNGATNNTSKRNNPDLYNTNLTTTLDSTNFKMGNFGVGLFVKSFLGRDKGKLVWETKRNYSPYDGTPITNSVAYTSQQTNYTDLGLTGAELKSLVEKQPVGNRYTRVRVRVKYNLATAITGQLYGPWRYVPEQVLGLSLGVLPVDLISFKVTWEQVGKTAKINFTTDNESAISYYEIEKSNDGFNFLAIGHLTAANTSSLYTYSFIDNNATGKKQYYRLKTIHQDGHIDYSNIHLLRHINEMEIIVFPNPAADILHLQLNDRSDKINVRIVNSAGVMVKQMTNVPATGQTIAIPVSTLPSGVYFLYFHTGDKEQVLQFIKN